MLSLADRKIGGSVVGVQCTVLLVSKSSRRFVLSSLLNLRTVYLIK